MNFHFRTILVIKKALLAKEEEFPDGATLRRGDNYVIKPAGEGNALFVV